MAGTAVVGPLRSKTKETDGEVFIHAREFSYITGTWTFTRSAIGNYFFRHTAASESAFAVLPLSTLMKKIGTDPILTEIYGAAVVGAPASEAHDIRGLQLTAIDLVYAIGTDLIAAHTAALRRTAFANNVALAITVPSTLTGVLQTATQASPYLTTLTVDTPFIVNSNTVRTADYLEIAMDATGHATAVYDLYGAFFRLNYNLL